jgi:hypothetical protein
MGADSSDRIERSAGPHCGFAPGSTKRQDLGRRVLCGLTFELRRPARRATLGPRRTMEPATALRGPRVARLVGSPLERGVRPQCCRARLGYASHACPASEPWLERRQFCLRGASRRRSCAAARPVSTLQPGTRLLERAAVLTKPPKRNAAGARALLLEGRDGRCAARQRMGSPQRRRREECEPLWPGRGLWQRGWDGDDDEPTRLTCRTAALKQTAEHFWPCELAA